MQGLLKNRKPYLIPNQGLQLDKTWMYTVWIHVNFKDFYCLT